MTKKTILVTGCSSGIGRATARHFQEKGWNVIATVRKPENESELNTLDNVLVNRIDVTDHDSIDRSMQEGIQKFGRIDVVLNNAGYGSYGLLEATPIEKIRRQFDVNVIGSLAVAKAIIPHFRAHRDGVLINIASMGGKVSFPLGTLYHGSKFAVEGMSEALSHELDAIGVRVKIVEPGAIRTNFGGSSFDLNLDPELTEYETFVKNVMGALEKVGGVASEASVVADVIYQAATDDTKQLRYVVGADAEQIIAARKQMDDDAYLSMIREQFGLAIVREKLCFCFRLANIRCCSKTGRGNERPHHHCLSSFPEVLAAVEAGISMAGIFFTTPIQVV